MCANFQPKLPRVLNKIINPPPGNCYARQVGRIKKVIKTTHDIRLASLSAEIAFYIVLSFFPFLIFLVSLAGMFATSYQEQIYEQMASVMPLAIAEAIRPVIQDVLNGGDWSVLTFSMIGVLWSASQGFAVLLNGLNQAYGDWKPKTFTKLILRGLGLLSSIMLGLSILLVLVFIAFGQFLINQLAVLTRLPQFSLSIVNATRFLLIFILLFLMFSILYYFISNGSSKDNKAGVYRQSLPGAVFTSISWILLSAGFSFYIDNFAKFNSIYGSLAGVMLLMLWVYLCCNVILVGGIVNAVLYDFTRPPPNEKMIR